MLEIFEIYSMQLIDRTIVIVNQQSHVIAITLKIAQP